MNGVEHWEDVLQAFDTLCKRYTGETVLELGAEYMPVSYTHLPLRFAAMTNSLPNSPEPSNKIFLVIVFIYV